MNKFDIMPLLFCMTTAAAMSCYCIQLTIKRTPSNLVFRLLSSPPPPPPLASIAIAIAVAAVLSEPSRSFLIEASTAAAALTAAMAAAAASACSFASCCDLATSTAWASPDASGTASEPERRLGLMRFLFGRPLVEDVEVEGGEPILFVGEWVRWDWAREFPRRGWWGGRMGIRVNELAAAAAAAAAAADAGGECWPPPSLTSARPLILSPSATLRREERFFYQMG